MPPPRRRARPALARLRPLHGPLGPGPAQARLHTVRPHMATHGPSTHLTSRLLTLRWLGTLRGLSPLSLAARLLSTPLTPPCAVRRSHRAGLLRRRSPHPRSRCSAQDPPAHRSPCMLHHTHLTPRSESARPGPDSRLTPHSASRLILSGGWSGLGNPRRALSTPPRGSRPRVPTPCPATATHRVTYPAQARDRPDPTLTHTRLGSTRPYTHSHKARLGQALHSLTQGSARPGPFAPLRSLPARPGPLTSLTPSPSMQANSTSRRHGARMARFVAPPSLTLLLLTSR